jgi:6-pyruvoyltetrahydropterin/6-carboxytetrahydropterin synthase
MFEVRVETDFAAAHFLQDYNGKCENLHGHNYLVRVHVAGPELNAGGMLLDFTRLKKALRDVCGKLDHTNLNDLEYFQNNPSAERIAMYICQELLKLLPELTQGGNNPAIRAVDVFETATSRARYIPD